jgi:Uma2 family endonuclease
MSLVTQRPNADRVVVRNVSWETYEYLLQDLANQSSPRLTYDQGVLEIMSPHFGHDVATDILGDIVKMVLEEMRVDFVSARSTTYKRKSLRRGFEPDGSFYIRNAKQVRGKKPLDMEVDPPPDFVIEMDITTDSMDKFPLLAALGVSEVWRCEVSPEIWVLQEGKYVRQCESNAIPVINETLLNKLLESSQNMERPLWAGETRQRIRELLRQE